MARIAVLPFFIARKMYDITLFPVDDYLKKNGSTTVADNKAAREKMMLSETKDMKNVIIVKVVNHVPLFQCISTPESFGRHVANLGILSSIADDPTVQLGYFYFGDYRLVEYFSKDAEPVVRYRLADLSVIEKCFNCYVNIYTVDVKDPNYFDFNGDLVANQLINFMKV